MTAQIEIVGVTDPEAARARIERARTSCWALAHAALPRLAARGGGARELEVRAGSPGRVIVHVHIDCRDAMGANMVNTVAETLAERVASLAGGRAGLRILTNLCDRRLRARGARVPAAALATQDMDGAAVRDGIVAASRFAEDDPYRAATHNKGIMNGVDAVVIATGNDWRGVEAGAHAFAAASGRYRPLRSGGAPWPTWRQRRHRRSRGRAGDAHGRRHGGRHAAGPRGRAARAAAAGRDVGDDAGHDHRRAGLASNLAALRALATEGIQRGHMALHRVGRPWSSSACAAKRNRRATDAARSVDVARRAKRNLPR